MIRRRKPEWQRLISAFYVPPFLHFGDPYPCDNCCKCPCPQCDGDTPPCCFKVVISGIVEGSCGECDCLNDTFYVPRYTDCIWHQDTTPFLCDSHPIRVTVYLDGSDYKLKVELGGNVWIKNYGATKPTCQNLTDESIAYSTSGSDCDASSSTCLVTAIEGDGNDVCPPPATSCPNCICNLAPTEFQVVISGVANGCCTGFNDTFIFTRTITSCVYRVMLDPTICSASYIQLQIVALGGYINIQDSGLFIGFQKFYGSLIDCRNLVDENIPVFIGSCDQSVATCLVTSLP